LVGDPNLWLGGLLEWVEPWGYPSFVISISRVDALELESVLAIDFGVPLIRVNPDSLDMR
jgi:hypothetical protein